MDTGIETLERLWSGIDNMKERITRLEEQMKTVYNSVDRIEKKLDKLIDQTDDQQVEISTSKIQIGNGERVFWLLLSAGIGLAIYWVKSG
jgi:predicted  nucleic acid-binding Zn-ribbon protein